MGSDGSRKPGPATRGKKHAGGMFFRAWETPLISGRIRYGCERKANFFPPLPHKRKVFFMGSDGSRKPGPAMRGKKHAGGMSVYQNSLS